MGLISILWLVVGFSLAFGDDIGGIIGNPATFFMFDNVGWNTNAALSPTIPLAIFALFQMKFAILTPALITGSFAERVHFSAYVVFIALFSLIVYSPLAHMLWHPDGLFKSWGVTDFAGGLVVHTSSGVAALAGAIFLGRRKHSSNIPVNIPFVLLGTALLWIGWFGFNAGSSLAVNGIAVKAFLNTNTAAAVAMITWITFDALMGRKPGAVSASVGAVAGLVGITPMAGMVTAGESLFVGFITALICNLTVYAFSNSVDDALDVFPTHGVGGMVGSLLTGVFVNGLLDGNTHEFLMHVAALAITVIYTFTASYLLYYIINKFIPMRVSEESEDIGLDISQHNEKYGI
ncbi:MAG: ammonium transporter, partial [Mucispirillum sp.]|nr:ammonium transporter [Mucispirillum sp.]